MPKINRDFFWIVLILSLASVARVAGINFGLPHLYHADEPIVVNHALAYGTGDLNPHYFKLPPFVSYLLFFCFGLYYLAAYALGYVSSTADFQNLFLSDPSSFYLLGRLGLGAGLGTLNVYVLFRLINRFFDRRLALGTSFLFAVNFLHVSNSHYIYLDVPLLLIATISFFPIFDVLDRNRMRDYVIFGLCLGLAVGTKYNGFFILIPFLFAHLLANRKRAGHIISAKLIAAGFASIIVFLVINPFAVFDFPAFTKDLFSMHEYEGRLGWTHHLFYSLNGSLGTPVLIFALAGIASSFFRMEKKRCVMIVYAISYYAVLANFSQQHARYVFPLLPFMCFFACDMFDRLTVLLPKFQAIYFACVLLIAIPSILKVYHCDRILMTEDVRTTALNWIEAEIPSGSKIALDSAFFMPRLKPTLEQLEEKQLEARALGSNANKRRLEWMIENAKSVAAPRFELYFLSSHGDSEFLFAKPSAPFDTQRLKELGIEYVIVVRINRDYLPDFYSELGKNSEHVKRFNPYQDPSRDWPISGRPLTGAPFLMDELTERNQNGQILDIYKLSH